MALRPRRRLLHTSDVHLGAYDSSSAERSAAMHRSFQRVIDVGLRAHVDAMLIAGDFFDNARVNPETLEFAANEIARLQRPVVIAPGNHDHVGPGSVYDRYDFAAAAPNLRLMRDPDGEQVALEALDIEVWGRSHSEQLHDFAPFAGAPPRGEAAWQIGIGHGHFIHPRAALDHSYHIREEQLAATERDYVALGHWEQMARVAAGGRVTAAYSGAPQGLAGINGGYAMIVDLLEDGSVRLTAHSLGEAAPIAHDDIPLLAGL